MTRRLRSTLASVAVLAAIMTGCSCSSSGPDSSTPSTVGPGNTLPESTGFTCDDPKGDVIDAAKQTELLTEPAGIDLVKAEAHVDGDALAVTFTTAGPISLAPEPFFDLLQGAMSAPAYSWEIRAEQHAGGQWVLELTNFAPLASPGGQATTTGLSAQVTVSGNTLSYRVPLNTIPAIATLQWNFGSSSTQADGSVRIDDCTSLSSATTTTAGDGTSTTTG